MEGKVGSSPTIGTMRNVAQVNKERVMSDMAVDCVCGMVCCVCAGEAETVESPYGNPTFDAMMEDAEAAVAEEAIRQGF